MTTIRDFFHILKKGALQDDRPLFSFILGLIVLAFTLIVYGVAK
ncbi:hypothetical protein [Geobacter sp.]|nr:hypothetical protein [Geobacter sp.]